MEVNSIARSTKCFQCQIQDTEEKIVEDNKRIHTGDCYEKYKEQKQRKVIENQEWSDLYEHIKQLHNALDVPPRNIKRLRGIKLSKNISYKLILDAYKIADDKLRWFIRDVLQDSNDAEAINKAMTVMLNSGLNEAYKQEKLKEQKQKSLEAKRDEFFIVEDKETKFIKKKDENDISDFLD